jgi:hypothetical protein
MRDICFLKYDNTPVEHYVVTDDFYRVKTIYSISVIFFFNFCSVLFWSLYVPYTQEKKNVISIAFIKTDKYIYKFKA